MKRNKTTALWVIVSLSLLAVACSDDEIRIVEGNYMVSGVSGYDGPDLSAIEDVNLTVDRSNRTATFTLRDGTQQTYEWASAGWISDCPTMTGTYRLEVLEILDATLMLESMEFVDPVIVSACSPNNLALQQAADIDAEATNPDPSAVKAVGFWRFH